MLWFILLQLSEVTIWFVDGAELLIILNSPIMFVHDRIIPQQKHKLYLMQNDLL
jgi:hypothetical protein